LAFLAAGVIKGTLGVGLPIAAVGLMTQFIDPRLAISLVVFPIMFSNIWQIYRAGEIKKTVMKYWMFAVVLAISLMITTSYTAKVATDFLVAFVGVVIILFSLMNLMSTPPSIPEKFDRPGQLIAGLTAGVMGGFTAIWSPPIAAYLIARNTNKDGFVRATGFLFLVGSIPLCLGFWQNGLMTGPVALVSTGMIIPTLAGFSVGEIIRRKLKPDRFKRLVLFFFLLIGLNLIRKAVYG
jgi:uncharacterized membrane protein YfcA